MTFQLLLNIILAAALAVVGFGYIRRRRRQSLRAVQVRRLAGSSPAQAVKCHVKIFEYSDRATVRKHSVCDGLGLEGLTDEKAAAFHPEATLVHVRNQTHEVRA